MTENQAEKILYRMGYIIICLVILIFMYWSQGNFSLVLSDEIKSIKHNTDLIRGMLYQIVYEK